MRKVDYKRVTDKNRDKDLKSEFCRSCEYFNSNPCSSQKCNKEFDYCDTYKRFVEIYDRLVELEDRIEDETIIIVPLDEPEPRCFQLMWKPLDWSPKTGEKND